MNGARALSVLNPYGGSREKSGKRVLVCCSCQYPASILAAGQSIGIANTAAVFLHQM